MGARIRFQISLGIVEKKRRDPDKRPGGILIQLGDLQILARSGTPVRVSIPEARTSEREVSRRDLSQLCPDKRSEFGLAEAPRRGGP
jgi:hypothetical protein